MIAINGTRYKIALPEANRDKWLELMKQIQTPTDYGFPLALDAIEMFQELPKHWPSHTNIPEYCLYLGSFDFTEINRDGFERRKFVDLYHYRDWNSYRYSAAIVFGNEGHEYCSGWVGMADSAPDHRQLWCREYQCNLLSDKWLIEYAKEHWCAPSHEAYSRALTRLRTQERKA